MVHAYNSSTCEAESGDREMDREIKASLGYRVRPYIKKKKKKVVGGGLVEWLKP
jgi:hypothetical protein